MLAPDSRTLLLDSLRPAPGYALDHAIATTFTLDLMTALTVPLAFAGFSVSSTPDPVALLEAVRSTAGRLDIFCQTGMVNAPPWPSDLVALLEGVVHTVNRPRPGRLFHPKLWVVRYRNHEDQVAYRCLVLSRNLTGDDSWDVVLRLENIPDEGHVNRGNDGLVRLIRALPDLTGVPVVTARRERILEFADELRRVSWLPPDDVDEIRFLTFGLPRTHNPDTAQLFHGYRHLLISPFITADGINTLLSDQATDVTVVGRTEELDNLPADTLDDIEVFVINPLAGLTESSEDGIVPGAPVATPFGALHAKVYVIESNRRAYVYLGSPNATGVAFSGNIEILCELTGSVTKLGAATMIGDKGDFMALLEPYTQPEEPKPDSEADAAWRLESLLIDIAESGFTATCLEVAAAWELRITTAGALPEPAFASDLSLTIAPYNTPNESHRIELGRHVEVTFAARAAAEITPFLLIDASATIDGIHVSRRVVAVADLMNSPATRIDDILIRQLDTPEKFMRFLLLLLALGAGQTVATLTPSNGNGGTWSTRLGSGIFELLVRALATSPESIDRLHSVVERLRESDLASTVLPPDWDVVWQCVSSARAQVGQP